MKIITNNQPRPLLDWSNLTEKEQQEFDWLAPDEKFSADFFRYKGQVYCLNEFERNSSNGWDGFYCHTFFSGVFVKLIQGNNDEIIVGSFYN